MANVEPYRILFAFLFLTILVRACNSESEDDTSVRVPQFGQQVNARALNALGDKVSLADFSGRPVWVDYAAEWCAACGPQSATIRSLADVYRDDVAFITVMTSEPEAYGHPATPDTARRWARRTLLDPARVVAADFTSMTLPQHALFSPNGTQVFRHTGSLSAAQIRSTLERFGSVDH